MNQYFSQIGQDQYFIENICHKKHNGIFLDVGANNGIFQSNTAALELYYNWSGICIEANPNLIKDLITHRPKSQIVNCAVWNSEGEIELEIPLSNYKNIKGDLLSRISSLPRNNEYFQNHFQSNTEKIKIPTKTLTSIISTFYNLPCVIDYMSLDIEGAELEALKGLDLEKIDIKFMTIEHGDREGYIDEFFNYLKHYGYKIHRINKWDVEFCK